MAILEIQTNYDLFQCSYNNHLFNKLYGTSHYKLELLEKDFYFIYSSICCVLVYTDLAKNI